MPPLSPPPWMAPMLKPQQPLQMWWSDYLAAAPTGQTNTMADGNYIIQGLPAGYYLVKDMDGSLQGEADTATDYIVQVLGNVTMDPKDSDIPRF